MKSKLYIGFLQCVGLVLMVLAPKAIVILHCRFTAFFEGAHWYNVG